MLMKTHRDGNGVKHDDINAPGLASLIVKRIGEDAWTYSVVGHGAGGVAGLERMKDMVHPDEHVRLMLS